MLDSGFDMLVFNIKVDMDPIISAVVDELGILNFQMEPFVEFSVYFHDRNFIPTHLKTEMWLWDCTNHIIPPGFRPVLTREVCRTHRVTGRGIRSHALHGVDNTGNVRVWVR